MPRRREGWIPKLTHLKRAGRGRVRIPGRPDLYLGTTGSWPAGQPRPPEAIRRGYERAIAEWLHRKASAQPAARAPGSWTCGDVAQGYCQSLAGRPSASTADLSLRPVVELYGDTPAAEFTAERFCVVRGRHLERGCAPRAANDYMAKVKAAFRWAARPERKGVPAAVALELSLVTPLVDEGDVPLEEVPLADVLAALPFCPPTIRAMLELQLLSGMRPGEVCQMRVGDIHRDQPGGCWLYLPGKYKSRRSAAVRQAGGRKVWLGPKAQDILRPWLDGKAPEDAVFPSQLRGPYGTAGYRVAVVKACLAAGVEPFQPRQVRHTALTLVEGELKSIDYAQAVGGHSKPDVSRRYAHAQDRLAQEAMSRLG